MVVQAEAAEEVLERDPARARDALVKIQRSGREALVELRRLLGILKEDGAEAEHAPAPGLHPPPDRGLRAPAAGARGRAQVAR
jgi:hypothetical protein